MLNKCKAIIQKYWPIVLTAIVGFITFMLTRKERPEPVVNEAHAEIDYKEKVEDVKEHQQQVVKVQEAQAEVVKNEEDRPAPIDSKRDLRNIVDDFNNGV